MKLLGELVCAVIVCITLVDDVNAMCGGDAASKHSASRHHRSCKQQDSQQQSEDHPTTAGDVERQQQEPVSCEAPPLAAAIASVERAPQQLTDSASSGHVAKGRGAMSHAEIWDKRRRIVKAQGNIGKLGVAQACLRRYQHNTVVAARHARQLESQYHVEALKLHLKLYLRRLMERVVDSETSNWAVVFRAKVSSELGAIILVQIGDCKTVVQVRQTENDSALEGASDDLGYSYTVLHFSENCVEQERPCLVCRFKREYYSCRRWVVMMVSMDGVYMTFTIWDLEIVNLESSLVDLCELAVSSDDTTLSTVVPCDVCSDAAQ
eukprot:Lankesteria_metandrocarpae@DN5151_c1_g1_i4.p1